MAYSKHDANQSSIAEQLAADSADVNWKPDMVQRRIFVGPMPERVISQTEAQRKRTKLTIGSVFSLSLDADKPHNLDKTEEVSRLLKEHAFRFFLHEGGNPEDWGEEEEQNVVDELLKRWKTSEWGQLWLRRHHHRKGDSQNTSTSWFGTSFEIGTLMGVNILQGKEHIKTLSVHPPSKVSEDAGSYIVSQTRAATGAGQEPFVTVASIPVPSTSRSKVKSDSIKPDLSVDQQELPTPASSMTGLLPPQPPFPSSTGDNVPFDNLGQANRETPVRPIGYTKVSGTSTQMGGQSSAIAKGKAKAVHYADSYDQGSTTSLPVPPEQVLQRTHSSVDPNTSLAASFIPVTPTTSPTPSDLQWGDVVLRDRMLVRVSYTKAEGLAYFDDTVNRTTRNLHFEDWGEFIVVWRKDSIEIYEDHSTPGKEWITGHKSLAYVIPLKSSKTRLSLYSFVDLTFCITCAPTTTRLNAATSRWIFSREKEGTNIFVFKLKSRTRAYDWTWQLWRQMGGRIPSSVDIYSPRLNTKVKIDIPGAEGMRSSGLYRSFSRENVISLCMESLHEVPDWKYVLEREIKQGKSLQLAWRVNANLDWVWLEEDVLGKTRDWAVLCGLAFKQAPRPPVLEIRLSEHAPTHIHLKDGKHIEEPPAIEGYLDRIRPNSQTKQQTYVSTHNGNIFTLNTHTAFPPMPPGLAPSDSGLLSDPQALRQAEIRRGTNQIMTATGVCDFRTIIAVRRAFQTAPTHMHDQSEATTDESWFSIWENPEPQTSHDEEDEGGDQALAKSGDRARLRMRRSFELLLNTGHVVRFEAYSCRVAIEWIERLRALMFYWKSRQRIDAKQEIELAQARRPRLTPQTRVCQDDHDVTPEAPADLSAPYAAIDSLYNWCILEGCRPIIKVGKIYIKKGLHGQYKLFQLYLVAGHLVRFRIGPQSSLYTAVRKKINLLDAYVCSGYFAALTLPSGEYTPNAVPTAKRYQDGLETDDRDEDILFMIWYRSQPQMNNADQDPTVTPVNSKSVPTLSAKNKMLVFKTRSNLERDAWCWALNSEIEKIVRAQKDREEKLRETGNLVKLG
ncbi:Pleckstrin homology domain-containing protein [Crassisporium funariophilum]|nr:Pleckstrin homology domain-containing protein [Crassisporium funariophilum]